MQKTSASQPGGAIFFRGPIVDCFTGHHELALILIVIIWLLLIVKQQPKSVEVLLLRSRDKKVR
ncbi:MAG: hypothetical protein A2Z14_13740 [Chloroflexi bacterium RBG_16_48_8]|nr:MAG: hypothetical protein A2Z14_13740 [Chloroflexi bacterium RBG_16_48_8]